MKPSLDGVKLKVQRARTHRDAFVALADVYRSSHYQVVRQENHDTGHIQYVLSLPVPDPASSVVIGDCIHNLRSALDHIVWQLVLVNGKQPGNANMFPVCDTPDMFLRALKRDRLCGVHPKAKSIIERLQPYQSPVNEALWKLHELENVDKHRALIVTGGIVADQHITAINPTTKKQLGTGQWLNMLFRNGDMLFGCGIGSGSPYEHVEVQAHSPLLIEIQEPTTVGLPAINQLAQLIDFIEQSVVPRFDPFF